MNTPCTAIVIDGHRGVAATKKLWKPGAKISVGFLDGTIAEWERTLQIAKMWEKCGNFTFYEELPERASVRIVFEGSGNWSFVGTDCLKIKEGPTMSLSLYEHDALIEWNRTVLHEFGHVLGLEHEHKHQQFTFQNKQDAVEFLKKAGWSDAYIQMNLFDRNDLSDVYEFDNKSIMLYTFDRESNTEISIGDCKTIGKLYPFEHIS